ncbi:MAG: hypothetical protein CBB72_015640 [Muricauda sp. TMED12]|nr:MAG: hypothetical protein CBB72_015640 [Muricauda sp. TMED12]|tara:strand:- start:6696 stop:7088 length:393 start_codon:yes stop_codon:yes gene_type:complete
MKKKHIIRIITLTGLILFTTITLILSTSILLDILGIREQQGHYVPLIIWSNFLCGCLYILSIIGLFTHKKWSIVPMVLALFILVGAFFGLYFHIMDGGLYEDKTIMALFFRITLTLFLAFGTYVSTKPLL